MKKSEMPTLAQVGYIRDTAIELGITREMLQTLRDDGTWTRVLKERRDKILADRDNCLTFELKATVRQDRPYTEALEAGGPDTPSGYSVHEVGDLYPSVSERVEEVEFVLRNFLKGGGSWDNALTWAKSNGYKVSNPREVFAVAEQHDLRKLLERDCLYLVATTECSFEGDRQTVYVSVGGSGRRAGLRRLGHFGDGRDWFLFRK